METGQPEPHPEDQPDATLGDVEAELAALADEPVEAHRAVYERALERVTSALDGSDGGATGDAGSSA